MVLLYDWPQLVVKNDIELEDAGAFRTRVALHHALQFHGTTLIAEPEASNNYYFTNCTMCVFANRPLSHKVGSAQSMVISNTNYALDFRASYLPVLGLFDGT